MVLDGSGTGGRFLNPPLAWRIRPPGPAGYSLRAVYNIIALPLKDKIIPEGEMRGPQDGVRCGRFHPGRTAAPAAAKLTDAIPALPPVLEAVGAGPGRQRKGRKASARSEPGKRTLHRFITTA